MKKVFISGAGGGIGKELARAFSNEGYYVIGQYRKTMPEFCNEVICADFSDPAGIKYAADYLSEKHPDQNTVQDFDNPSVLFFYLHRCTAVLSAEQLSGGAGVPSDQKTFKKGKSTRLKRSGPE